MKLGEAICASVERVLHVPCYAGVYTGAEPEYCTWNASEFPAAFGGNRPRALRYLVQVHWYFPFRDVDPTEGKRELRRALMEIPGGTCPSVEDASDLSGGHLIFEFEAVSGEV